MQQKQYAPCSITGVIDVQYMLIVSKINFVAQAEVELCMGILMSVHFLIGALYTWYQQDRKPPLISSVVMRGAYVLFGAQAVVAKWA